MDTQIQSSFIPKKPVTGSSGSSASSSANGGVLQLIGTIVFVVALTGAVGVFGYEKFLEGRIAKMQTDLEMARQELQPDLIAELSRANSRFLSAEEILNKHKIVSELFNLLETQTLPNVRFTSFGYDDNELGLTFDIKGEAKSYATLAYQAKVLSENPYIINAQFSDFDLNEDGNVVFSLKANINPNLISYEEVLKRNNLAQSLPPVDSTQVTSLGEEIAPAPAPTPAEPETNTTP
ncbi:MAG: hypothetical protein A3E93_01140 [Candidatus Zambryskibacteria bacterium RIFCSPHIGHO2_12_FULL_43_12b]|uniref:PilN domain-containing protein n=1 Tax=Candidatus Zambryskibacteria bacterium RIFCSPLOWO2_01_FULL_43_17 TaxID=1802760 RepID=A0A1G2U0S9_9BACT|nr:MAG: hypothetical protein A3E93_01140 [Candidatus Zambryskibacteria bacterium RIFCSPHIGHO2_12_FULL_43_12b]OHB03084.1 MAG: hypothetical protein A2920_00260 [Candidatus Zambryskibacteria bacterium RIFCSPLOWO2_01_FULL_43_17]